MAPFPESTEEPRGSARQGQQRHLVFDRRKLHGAGIVPAPVAALAAVLAVAATALFFSKATGTGTSAGFGAGIAALA
ncbi:MAG: hypothetical protein Q6373_009465, partial [Candidatus Sigynarchaeota archaeon]